MLMTASARPARDAAPPRDGLFAGWSAATAASALFLLGAGGMVTSTGSGLAVPDWPLSFGQVMPRMTGGVFYEHGHRMIAGVVALMSLAQAVLSLRPGVGAEARAACRWAAGLIVVQALLGGLTVLMRLPPAVSISHACLGQAVFCLLLASAIASSASYQALPRDEKAGRTFILASVAFAAAFAQLLLGALLRHTGAVAPLHVLWAFAVLLLAAAAVFTAFKRGPASLRGPALLVALVVPGQIALGLLAYRVRYDATFLLDYRSAALWRTIHLVGGAATLGSCSRWRCAPGGSPDEGPPRVDQAAHLLARVADRGARLGCGRRALDPFLLGPAGGRHARLRRLRRPQPVPRARRGRPDAPHQDPAPADGPSGA